MFSKYESEDNYFKEYKTQYSGLSQELAKNINLLSLEHWYNSTYLLRLEHFYQNNESTILSKPVNISLKNIFSSFKVIKVVEQTLGANQNFTEFKNRLKFNANNDKGFGFEDKITLKYNEFEYTLKPMEIKTFLIEFNNKLDII